jgi:dinuclear metal center YbgI/SA1388 family protein
MAVNIQTITRYLEQLAPSAYQESYDNSGLICGNPLSQVTGILCSLDATEAVVDEAIREGCNLVVAHHPIVFKGLKSITGRNYVERTIIRAIKHDVAIYAIHTNLDNISTGVNKKISDILGLTNTRVLAPKPSILRKLTTFVPLENTGQVLNALSEAGAGNIGNYKNCSFQLEGKGTFQPTAEANPHIGEAGKLEHVKENRVEVLFPAVHTDSVLRTLKATHPYEEVAYYLHELVNDNQEVGSGMIGKLPQGMEVEEFLTSLKEKLNLPVIRHTALVRKEINSVAVCGGAGSFLLKHALRQQADVFITADYKYHEFFDADGKIIIADIGHYESEIFTKDLLKELLSEKFANFAVRTAKTVTNPVLYF